MSYSKKARSKWNPESWDALEIIAAELDDRCLPRPGILQTWLNDKARSNRKRPKNGGQATLVRDIALAEEVQRVSTAFDVDPTRTDEKKGPKRSGCDVVAKATGLSYHVVKKAWFAWGPNGKRHSRYYEFFSKRDLDLWTPSRSRIGIEFNPKSDTVLRLTPLCE